MTTGQVLNGSDSEYSNPAYDALYVQQAAAVDPAKRKQIVDQMQQILYRDAPYVILWYNVNVQAYRTDTWTGYVSVPPGSAPGAALRKHDLRRPEAQSGGDRRVRREQHDHDRRGRGGGDRGDRDRRRHRRAATLADGGDGVAHRSAGGPQAARPTPSGSTPRRLRRSSAAATTPPSGSSPG